ncbi:methyltransferase domain-containing protein [Candidatus Bathyarchaeota archaeon]|nr:methyltransferase domain-containing protein [Candidatus Bathyarchaeota archaeon]
MIVKRDIDLSETNVATYLSEIEDCTSEWTFSEETFDYIHARWLVGSIADWTALYKEAFKALKPGGWLETHEPSTDIVSQDDTVSPQTALGQWGMIFVEGGRKLGRSFDIVKPQLQRKAMEEAGFVDIQEVDLTVR